LDKGVLLIALGPKYSELAFNLTKSIKKHNEGLPVAVITDCTYPEIIEAFDHVIRPKPIDYTEEMVFNPFKLKTFMYDLSPFEKTIYLDVDAICLGDISELFSKFQIQEVARHKKEDKCDCVWFESLADIFDLYELKWDYPEYNSSFVAFDRSMANETYFELVKLMYNDRRFDFTKIGQCYPDEMAFGLASSIMQHYSVDPLNIPICFWWANKTLRLDEIQAKYKFIGFAGGYVASKYLGYYHQLMKQLGSPYWRLEMKNKIFHNK
jgi:hypothetical protein